MQSKSEEIKTAKSVILGICWGVYFGFALILGVIAMTYYTKDWVVPKHF